MEFNKMKDKPIAVCSSCKQFYYIKNVDMINERCNQQIMGKQCSGLIKSALNIDDWEICPTCNGNGCLLSKTCNFCQGTGWIYKRIN
jgi:hypothetical protein